MTREYYDPATGEVISGETAGTRRRRAALTSEQEEQRTKVLRDRGTALERDRLVTETLAATFTEDDVPIRSERVSRVDEYGAIGRRILTVPEAKGSELVVLAKEQEGELGPVRQLALHKRYFDGNGLPWRTRGVTITEGEALALRDALTSWLEPAKT